MFFLAHFMRISVCCRSRFVEVGWVAVKKGPGCVFTFDQLERGHPLDQDSAQPEMNLRQTFNR